MWIIGCDLHTRYQQLAAMNTATGETIERRLGHEGEQVRRFYAALEAPVRVGIEATGAVGWFEQLLGELGHELWVGNAGAIRAAAPRRQKTDVRDARLLLELLTEDRFPRIWLASLEERDVRQLLTHRAKLVGMRTAVCNQLQALALGQGLRLGQRLWSRAGRSALEQLALGERAAARRRDLLTLLEPLDARIKELDAEVEVEARRRPDAVRLMEQSGVGPVTALAFVLVVGPVDRFRSSRQLASYLGLIPSEDSSAGRQRLGHISKQGNVMLRWLLVEAGHTAARRDPELHRVYTRLKHRRGANIAKVAVARKLAVRLYWILRSSQTSAQKVGRQGSPATAMVGATPSHS
ncbi:MAG: IS110 family transposase [Acidobacteriota bacterium]|nr:IS110 family transposase [Acidobacteriota bacterium]